MKALILKEYNTFEYTDIEDPVIGDNDVLINIKACGVCGSDIHGMDGSSGRRIPPIVMGHEASGIISEVGNNVNNWNIGDRVTFDSTIYCGKCYFCTKGQINLCENRKVIGVSCNEYRQFGAFAEYLTVPSNILYKLPDQISFEEASMVEALSVAYHAINRVPININNIPVVVGVGMIGILIIQLLRYFGYKKIIAIDISDEKLRFAKKFSASFGFNPIKNDIHKEVFKISGKKGADISFEVVGKTESINTAINVLKKGSSLVLVGNISSKVEIPLQEIVKKEIKFMGSSASSGEYPICIDLIAQKKIDINSFISAVVPLSEGEKWMKRLYHNGDNIMKVIMKP